MSGGLVAFHQNFAWGRGPRAGVGSLCYPEVVQVWGDDHRACRVLALRVQARGFSTATSSTRSEKHTSI